jgi:hypothetical protein
MGLESESLHTKNYPEDFGHKFETNLARALKEDLTDVIEEVERATPHEDQVEKVDLWIKFRNVEDPVALQVTFTSNEERIVAKEREIENKPLVKKENRPDSLIKAKRNCHRILATYEKERAATGVVDRGMQAETIRQILAGLPNHSRVYYMKAIQDAMKKNDN